MDIILFAIAAYLLGSIPFGLVLTRMAGYGDIRKIGSGNIGATNVLRTGNKPLALLTLVLDGGKGAIAVGIAAWATHQFVNCTEMGACMPACHCSNYPVSKNIVYVAGLFSIIGHCFPVWLKFNGGKGVATTLGMLLALSPFTGLVACGTWLLMAGLFRISSLAALTALLSTPITAMVIYHEPKLAVMAALVTALVWYRHKANIQRLLKGEEPKIGKKDKKV